MAKVLRSARARADLIKTWLYIEERSGRRRADSVLRSIDRSCAGLAKAPLIGRTRDDLRPSLRSLAVGSYLIFYRPIADGIEVVRVVHGARNLEALFGD
jgi:toxin ParE1/3/4